MKIKVLLLILVPFFWAFSCDEKVTLVASYSDEYEFNVNETGNFGEREQIINPDDVTENVESDEIDEVNIESIAIKYKKYTDNDASSVTVDGTADGIDVFTNFTVNLSEEESDWMAITDQLNTAGVNHIKTKFKGFVNHTTFEPLVLKIVDQSNDTGQKVHLDLYLKISAGIVFTE